VLVIATTCRWVADIPSQLSRLSRIQPWPISSRGLLDRWIVPICLCPLQACSCFEAFVRRFTASNKQPWGVSAAAPSAL